MLVYDTPTSITAFSTTRDGGVSVHIPQLVMPLHQVHGTTTRVIDQAFLQKNPLEQALALDGVDALATQLPNVCICVRTADCIPVLLWDERLHVVAAVHAGWKGTVSRIVERSIEALQTAFGTLPSDLHAIIGPGIGPESFEVGDEVYDRFAEEGFPMPRLAQRYPDSRNPLAEKWHIDLWTCNRLQLTEKGVNPQHIHVAGIDTYQQYDRFFSARRHLDGRIINGIMFNSTVSR